MQLADEIIVETVLLLVFGFLFSFITWRIVRGKVDFGEFLNRYGEMLAYAGLLLVAVIVAIFRTFVC